MTGRFLLAFTLFALGCGGADGIKKEEITKENYELIVNGMTIDAVHRILGKQFEIESIRGSNERKYRWFLPQKTKDGLIIAKMKEITVTVGQSGLVKKTQKGLDTSK